MNSIRGDDESADPMTTSYGNFAFQVADPDRDKAKRVMTAMMTMNKTDIAALKKASARLTGTANATEGG